MIKLASIVLASSLGIAGLGASTAAEAHPFVRVGLRVPFVAPVVVAPAYYGSSYWGYSPYWRPGYIGYGHERYFRRWYRR